MQPIHHVHTRSRSRFSETGEASAILAAVAAARGNDVVLPVYYANRIVAWVCGERAPSRAVHWYRRRPGDPDTLWAGFNTIDDLINETTQNGKLLRQPWWNRFNAAMPTLTWVHLAGIGGWPGYEPFAGAALTARQFSETSKCAIANGGNKSPDTKHLIVAGASSVTATAAGAPVLLLYDLVLSYDRCTLQNVSQNMVNVLTAQRYAAAGEPGLRVMGVISTAIAGAGADFNTLTYVTPGGASKTIPNPADTGVISGVTLTGDTPPYNAFFTDRAGSPDSQLFLQLAAGDTGVASLTDFTMSATPASGEMAFLLGYPLAYFPINQAGSVGAFIHTMDLVKQLPMVPRLYDGACPTFALYSVGAHTILGGELVYAWG